MRSFTDEQGRHWEVAVGKESYGTLVLLFTARRNGELRRAALGSASRVEAEGELAGLSEDALRTQLAAAEPWR